ncbi:MAG TPA: S1/P1 nuclease, partial [Pyrinomonadaceae bacterium]|nr:S1/P1 nuclease [Pyrinomonadaceae bacterium]
MRKIASVLFLSLALFTLPTVVCAWGDTGHMLVSLIAYQRLNPTAKARVDALTKTIRFAGKTYDGTTLGVWMDDLRADSMHDDMRVWHYIDIPFFDGVPVDPTFKYDDENVVARIKWATDALRKGTGSDKHDAELLGYLFHLIGDVHQPLHAVTRVTAKNPKGDAGGNSFKLIGVPDNLHWYWDDAAGTFNFWSPQRPLDDRDRRRLEDFARALTAEFPADKNPEWQEAEPGKWAQESHMLAATVAYNLPESSTPTDDYNARARA